MSHDPKKIVSRAIAVLGAPLLLVFALAFVIVARVTRYGEPQ